MLLETVFFQVYTEHVIFGLQLGPQLGVKNLQIFVIFASKAQKTRWEPQKPVKACPGRLQDNPKTPEDELQNVEICIFLPQGYWKQKK